MNIKCTTSHKSSCNSCNIFYVSRFHIANRKNFSLHVTVNSVLLYSRCFFQIFSAREQIQLPRTKTTRSTVGIPAVRKGLGVQNRSRDRTKIGAGALWAGVTTCKSNISCSFDLHFTILPFPFSTFLPRTTATRRHPILKASLREDLVISAGGPWVLRWKGVRFLTQSLGAPGRRRGTERNRKGPPQLVRNSAGPFFSPLLYRDSWSFARQLASIPYFDSGGHDALRNFAGCFAPRKTNTLALVSLSITALCANVFFPPFSFPFCFSQHDLSRETSRVLVFGVTVRDDSFCLGFY